MTSKTCIQKILATRGLRKGMLIDVRRPHVLPDGAPGGYARCSECGTEHYVGEPRANRALAQFIAGPDAERVVRSMGGRW